MGLNPGSKSGTLLSIWAVSDGRAGIDNQVLGVAEAIGRLTPCEVVTKRVGWKAWLDPLPPALNPAPTWGLSSGSSRFEPPWPDVWIAAGRASLPLSIRMRARSGGRTFVVQLQDPRTRLNAFDMVAPPFHDRIEGPNVFPIVGSPHRVTAEKLATARAAFADRIDPMPHPRVAVLVGGKSKAFNLPPARAQVLANDLVQAFAAEGGALMMTFSRRTPAAAKAILEARLAHVPGVIWDGEGENPYFAFLAAADVIVVTEDSINMVAEACSTGKPVLIAKIDGGQWRKRLFHADLAVRDAARPFAGRFETFGYPPLRETDRLAAEILRQVRGRSEPTRTASQA